MKAKHRSTLAGLISRKDNGFAFNGMLDDNNQHFPQFRRPKIMRMKEIFKHKLFKLPEIQRLFLAYRIQYYRKYKNDEWITSNEGREVI